MKRLVLATHGFKLVQRGDTIAVLRGKSETQRAPLDQLSEVLVMAYGSISVKAIIALSERGIPVLFFKGSRYMSMLNPLTVGTVNTRRQQYRAYDDLRGFFISREIIAAKIDNQRAVLGTMAKNRRPANPELAKTILDMKEIIREIREDLDKIPPAPIEKTRSKIMNVEAKAAAIYWNAIKLLYQELGFSGRDRHAPDPINAALNLGYAILAGETEKGIHIAGLDPYGGYIHADRPGRKSLVYDIMEQFRPHVVDRTVFALASRGILSSDSITIESGFPRLTEDARKAVVQAILSRLNEKVYWKNARRTWSNTIAEICINISSFLRNQSPLTPFRLRW